MSNSVRSPDLSGGHQGHRDRPEHGAHLVDAAEEAERGDHALLGLHEDHGERPAVHAALRGLPAKHAVLRARTQPGEWADGDDY